MCNVNHYLLMAYNILVLSQILKFTVKLEKCLKWFKGWINMLFKFH